MSETPYSKTPPNPFSSHSVTDLLRELVDGFLSEKFTAVWIHPSTGVLLFESSEGFENHVVHRDTLQELLGSMRLESDCLPAHLPETGFPERAYVKTNPGLPLYLARYHDGHYVLFLDEQNSGSRPSSGKALRLRMEIAEAVEARPVSETTPGGAPQIKAPFECTRSHLKWFVTLCNYRLPLVVRITGVESSCITVSYTVPLSIVSSLFGLSVDGLSEAYMVEHALDNKERVLIETSRQALQSIADRLKETLVVAYDFKNGPDEEQTKKKHTRMRL